MNRFQVIAGVLLTIVSWSGKASAISLSGPISASSLNIAGGVTMSSMAVSNLIATNSFQILGTSPTLPNSLLQMAYSSTTVTEVTTSTTFIAVPNLAVSFKLTNATDYIRISVTGLLSIANSEFASGYLTIKRDTTDLGNTSDNSGLAVCSTNLTYSIPQHVPVGITIPYLPGDTNSHTYQVYIRSSSNSYSVAFPDSGVGYLLLEEIHL